MRPPISPAQHLLAVLRKKSDFKNGRVWYGKAITYTQIANWFGAERPSERTLQRWMAELKHSRQVGVKLARFKQGMFVTISGSAAAAPAPRQKSLFNEPVEIPVQKPAEVPAEYGGSVPPSTAAHSRQVWREKAVPYKKQYNNPSGAQPAPAPPNPVEDRKPWTAKERARKLEELYGLKRTLSKMPMQHPRFDEFHARVQRIEDELSPAFADTG